MTLQFKSDIAAYAVGRRANMEEWNTYTRTAEGNIGFGVPAMAGEGAHSCAALDETNGQNVLGITETNQVLPHPGDNYEQYDNVAICEFGVIGVLLGADVTKGQAARFDTANQAWTGEAQSATVVTIPGAEFDADGANGSVGVVRYRRPVPSLSVAGV